MLVWVLIGACDPILADSRGPFRYDELGQEFDLTEIGAEYQSQVKLIQHHHRLIDFANLELTTLRQSRKSTTDGLQESLLSLDAQHQTTLRDLSDLRRAKELSSRDGDEARRAEDQLQVPAGKKQPPPSLLGLCLVFAWALLRCSVSCCTFNLHRSLSLSLVGCSDCRT